MSKDIKRKDRQRLIAGPVPNDGPSMHDLVCDDLWQSGVAGDRFSSVIDDLQVRKQLGLDRYGSVLQARNGRDVLLDLYEELQDAVVYARQALAESGSSDREEVYDYLLTLLIKVRRLRDEHS